MPKYTALAVMVLLGLALPAIGLAQTQAVTPFVVDRTVTQLPDGPLYWQLQAFATRAEAEAAAGPTGQGGETEGQVWLFTLGPQGGAPAGGTLVAEIGPLPLEERSAAEDVIRIAYSSTPPGGRGPGFVYPHTGAGSGR